MIFLIPYYMQKKNKQKNTKLLIFFVTQSQIQAHVKWMMHTTTD